jgi:hypothetical protein
LFGGQFGVVWFPSPGLNPPPYQTVSFQHPFFFEMLAFQKDFHMAGGTGSRRCSHWQAAKCEAFRSASAVLVTLSRNATYRLSAGSRLDYYAANRKLNYFNNSDLVYKMLRMTRNPWDYKGGALG